MKTRGVSFLLLLPVFAIGIVVLAVFCSQWLVFWIEFERRWNRREGYQGISTWRWWWLTMKGGTNMELTAKGVALTKE